jgi:membrane protein DedA with SNARE-associated domain
MLSLTAMFDLNIMWVISCLDVVAGCTVHYLAGTYLERSEQTEKWKETQQISMELSAFFINLTLT